MQILIITPFITILQSLLILKGLISDNSP
jgi:ABC-2 family transporter protein